MNPTNRKTRIAPWVRPLLILPAMVVIVGLFQFIGSMIMGIDPDNLTMQKSPVQEVIDSFFSLLGMIAVISLFRYKIDKESFQSMGFYPKGFGSETIAGVVLGASIIAIGFATLILLNQIQWSGTNLDFNNLLWGLCLFLLVACFEELFLRGYVLNNLMKSMPPVIALLVSAAFFSLMHIFNSNFSWLAFWSILLAGILLGLPYIYTKSLWFPIALHFSWNFFQGPVFGFNVSGHVIPSVITQSRTVDNSINGGSFGFEGSLLCILFQVIAIGGLWWHYKDMSKVSEQNIVSENAYQEDVSVNDIN